MSTSSLLQVLILVMGISLRVHLPQNGALLPGPVELFVTLVLSAVAGLSMGLIISTVSSSTDRATTLVPVLLIPQIIFVVSHTEGLSHALAGLTFSRWSLQALGATVDLGKFAGGQAGLDPSEFSHTSEFLLSRWLILAGMGLTCVLVSFWLLKRHDGKLL